METTAPIRIAGSELGEARHVCVFVNSAEEEYRVLLPFIEDGFACGHKAVHIVSPGRRPDHLQRLTAAGIDPAAAEHRGQLELWNNPETFIHGGRFDPGRACAVFDELAARNSQDGFPLTRLIAQMDWVIDYEPCLDDLFEFESRINDASRPRRTIAICVYPLARLSGAMVIDAMRTHPMIIIGGILHQNPFFVPPQEFLPELRRRRARASTAP